MLVVRPQASVGGDNVGRTTAGAPRQPARVAREGGVTHIRELDLPTKPHLAGSAMVLLAALALSGLFRAPPPLTASRLATGARRLVTACASPCQEPRLLLTSSGLTTPELKASFFSMLRRASAPGATPKIAMLVTAQMAPSGTPSKRSPGELRRRRWQTAVKNARAIEAELGVEIECVDCAKENQSIEDFERPLATAECIWVTGGNSASVVAIEFGTWPANLTFLAR